MDKYIIVRSGTIDKLHFLVRQYIGSGYKPIGGVTIDDKSDIYRYIQVIFRE